MALSILDAALVCLSLNIYHESRSEPLEGMNAVAKVTMTRAERKLENVCDVVFKPKQFSWTASFPNPKDKEKLLTKFVPSDLKSWELSKHIARKAIEDKLLPGAKFATHFYNPNIVNPSWKNSMSKVATIGNHVFLRENK